MFGKNKSLIGLDIGSHCIKAVELSAHGDEFSVTGYGSPDFSTTVLILLLLGVVVLVSTTQS